MVDDGSDSTLPMTTHAVGSPPTAEPTADPAAWRQLLVDEERRCSTLGLRAGVLALDVGAPSIPNRTLVLDVLSRHLTPTDRVGVLSDHELAVLLVPVENAHDLEVRAVALDRDLRAAGAACAVGWALRRADGLLGAAGRADAAAATARRHLDVIDLR